MRHAVLEFVPPRHDAAAGGRAGGAGVVVGEAQALVVQAVEIGRLDHRIAVAGDVAVPLVVGQHQDDVGAARGGGRAEQGNAGQCGEHLTAVDRAHVEPRYRIPVQCGPAMHRREFVKTAAALPLVAQAQSKRRNIVFVLTDDHRYNFTGALGHPWLKGLTPNLDRMVERGVPSSATPSSPVRCARPRAPPSSPASTCISTR